MKINCPECTRHAFYSKDNAFWYCFVCGYTENEGKPEPKIRSPHIDSIRAIYHELSLYYHSCLEPEHRSYLNRRGITDTQIDTYKIGYCPDSMHILYSHPIIKETGLSTQRRAFFANRITFPYFYHGIVIDIRARLYSGDGEKYLSPYKSAYYRGADFAYNVTPAETIVITEGEIKAIVADKYNARGLPGIMSPRLAFNAPYTKAILCFDSQRNYEDIHRAIIKQAKRYHNPYIATLPLYKHSKQDIDSYILQYGYASFESVLKNAVPYKTWSKFYGYNE